MSFVSGLFYLVNLLLPVVITRLVTPQRLVVTESLVEPFSSVWETSFPVIYNR